MSISDILDAQLKPITQKLEAFETDFTVIKAELATLRKLLELIQIRDKKDKETFLIKNIKPSRKPELPKPSSSGRTFTELVLKRLEQEETNFQKSLIQNPDDEDSD